MKCIKDKEGNIKRVTDDQAERLVKSGWKYTSKAQWKKLVRDNK